MQDVAFMDEMAHFDRERIPERVVHAKGGGDWPQMRMITSLECVYLFYHAMLFAVQDSLLDNKKKWRVEELSHTALPFEIAKFVSKKDNEWR
jgi:hypothetical protein